MRVDMAELDELNRQLAELELAEAEESRSNNGPVPGENESGALIESRSETATIAPAGADRSFRKLYRLEGVTLDTGGFRSHSEFLDVLFGDRHDPRLKRAMDQTTSTGGGFAVPLAFSQKWFDNALIDEIVRPMCSLWPMDSRTLSIPAWDTANRSSGDLAGFELTFVAEGGTASRQTGKMRQMMLQAWSAYIFGQYSIQLRDNGVDFPAQLDGIITKSLAYGLDKNFLFGSGVARPQGCLSDGNPALIVHSKETGQVADTIVFENLTGMLTRLAPGSHKNAVWLANHGTFGQLMQLSVPVGTGGSHVPALKESNGGWTLFGKKCIFSELLQPLGDQGDIALCDLSQYAVGMRKESSIERTNAVGWLQNMEDFRLSVHFDGQSLWNSVLTPEHGPTMSPFIVLQERA